MTNMLIAIRFFLSEILFVRAQTIVSIIKSRHIYFTDGAQRSATGTVIPLVRTTTDHLHARLSATIRLSWVPVGVSHFGHRVTVRSPVRRRDNSPHEPGLSGRVYALSGRPEMHSTARALRCL